MVSLRLMITLALSSGLFAGAGVNQTQERRPLSGYAIQVTNKDGHASHFAMSGHELKGSGAFTISPWHFVGGADKGSDRVSLVKVAAAFEGGAWRIKVSVVKGEFYEKEEQAVATYLVREGEKVKVEQMRPLGVEPFDIAIVRLSQSPAVQPKVTNNTQSIEVINVEATTVPAPYRILLKNLSHKHVLAVEINTYRGDQRLFLRWPKGTWDRPLIEPGGTYEAEMSSAGGGRVTADEYAPEQATGIEISSVVFEDGTYEGTHYLAAVTRAQMMANRAQLRRVVPLLHAASGAEDVGVAVARLREAISLLGVEVEATQLNELHTQFPEMSVDERKNLVNFARHGSHEVKAALLKEIDDFEKVGRPMSGARVKEWLLKTKERYEQWLSGLRF